VPIFGMIGKQSRKRRMISPKNKKGEGKKRGNRQFPERLGVKG